jgi:hypothetical protein
LKDFFTLTVSPYWHKAFPYLVSYNRFVELMPWCLMLLHAAGGVSSLPLLMRIKSSNTWLLGAKIPSGGILV